MKARSLRQRFASFLRFRTWLRFSLRTLLLVTLLAAFAVKWWMTPEMMMDRQPDGAVIRYSMIRRFDPATGTSSEPQRHGRYEVRDKFGRLLVRGSYENGIAVGTWSVFHPNGRRAMNGEIVRGLRSGVWTAQNATGSVSSAVTYEVRSEGLTSFAASWEESYRTGIGELRDEKGRLDQGRFLDDYRNGEWVTTDSSEKSVERTTYRAGVRHGKSLKSNLTSYQESYYLHDHRVPQNINLLQRLREDLQSNDGGQQHEALRQVVTLGNLTEALLKQVLTADDKALQITALRLLAEEKSASEDVVRLVERLTKSSAQMVAIEAWFALYQLVPQRRKEFARELIHLAARSPLPSRYLVEYRLGEQVGPIPEVLASELESEDRMVCRATLEVLGVAISNSPIGNKNEEAMERIVRLNEVVAKAQAHKDPEIAAAAAQLEQRSPIQ